jgi:hypothetical protein
MTALEECAFQFVREGCSTVFEIAMLSKMRHCPSEYELRLVCEPKGCVSGTWVRYRLMLSRPEWRLLVRKLALPEAVEPIIVAAEARLSELMLTDGTAR